MRARKIINSLVKKILIFRDRNDLYNYCVKITKIYNDDEGKLMLKYYIPTWRITRKIAYSEFITSPLLYTVHPDQIISIAKKAGKQRMNNK